MAMIFGWIILSGVVGWVWNERGHNPLYGLLVSLLLSPIVGLIIGLVMKRIEPTRSPDVAVASTLEASKKCPFCAELIKAEAIVCRYCGRDLPHAGDAGAT